MEVTHGFVDGGYLRVGGRKFGTSYPNPLTVVKTVLINSDVDRGRNVILTRCNYYDADPELPELPDPNSEKYWSKITRLSDTHLRFGHLRGKPRRQKGVDMLLAVDMLVGAFTDIIQVAVLIAGDLDFLPAVQEIQRRGVVVILGAFDDHVAPLLKESVDRYVRLDKNVLEGDMI